MLKRSTYRFSSAFAVAAASASQIGLFIALWTMTSSSTTIFSDVRMARAFYICGGIVFMYVLFLWVCCRAKMRKYKR